MKLAALDLGTNTFLMLICEVSGTENSMRIERVYSDHLEITRLGQGVHQSQRLHPEALHRAEICFQKYQKIIQTNGVERTIAVATSAARDAINGQELFDLGRKYDIPISIIPGQMEAEISFQGATWSPLEKTSCTGKNNFAVIDVGGGSTEILFQDSSGQLRGESLNIGSVRLTEMFVHSHPIPRSEMLELRSYIQNEMTKFKKKWDPIPLNLSAIAVAGTPTSLACLSKNIEFVESEIQDFDLAVEEIEKSASELSRMNLLERQRTLWMDPKRADVIVAGALILSEASRMLNSTQVTVSTRGVRYGVALNWPKFS